MQAPPPPRLLPTIPPFVRLLISGAVVAMLVYLAVSFERTPVPRSPEEAVEPLVLVPELDRTLLATAHDATREQRLQLEAAPLRHLLQAAIDVGPTVAAALGMPAEPVPPQRLREQPQDWRGRWLWYEGELLDLSGPRSGHPIDGYGIFEATIRLPDGGHAMAAFSIPPDAGIGRGSWVRIEGYLQKLRDTTYPLDVREAPFLVGRAIQRDYADWGPVGQLDAEVMAQVDDSRWAPGNKMWHTLEEDQSEPLWHLAAYARDSRDDRSFAEWRRVPILSEHDFLEPFKHNEVPRGDPRRLIGTLIRRHTLAAPANPAGIRFWTIAWIQIREFGGATVPVWVPKRVADLPLRAQLEVRAHYYRRFAYETLEGQRRFLPLFVAADLDPYVLDTGPAMRDVGVALLTIMTGLIALFWWSQRRAARATLHHQRHMDERRRRRRERPTNRTASSPLAH